MLYEFINNNTIRKAPKHIKEGKLIISNPTKDKLMKHGYMPLVTEDYPETDEGYYRKPVYRVEGDKIIKSWSDPIAVEEVPERDR